MKHGKKNLNIGIYEFFYLKDHNTNISLQNLVNIGKFNGPIEIL